MTVIAVVTAGDVRRVLAGRDDAVVTGSARTEDLCVIDGVGRRPNVAVVAVLTDIARLYMCLGLACCFDTVVAAEAVADDANMVECGRTPGVRGVAVVTGIAAVDVRRVFARCCDAVVAGTAGANDLRVVDRKRRREHVGGVAVFADVAGLYMCRVLAGCLGAVVAADTVTGNVDVIEICRQPAGCGVTVVAGVATGNVGGVLAGRRDAIVTGSAGTGHLGVVDGVHRRKSIGIVAVLADVGRCYVRCVLAGRIDAVVTARTIARDIDVVEVGRYPACRRMTVVTIVTAVQVSWIFPGGRSAVMTRAAGANDLRVIYGKYGRENIGRMAVLTNIAGLNVGRVLSGGFGAVMAADAVAADVHMIEISRQPADGRVAVVAIIPARDMRRVFTGRRSAIVAGAAGAQHLSVIDRRGRRKGDCAVAVLANIGGLHVCRALPCRGSTVVAAHAVSSDACVIEYGREPGAHSMAIVTLVVG